MTLERFTTQAASKPLRRSDRLEKETLEVIDEVAEPPWTRPRAAYVHIPFCVHKCGYCDFASLAGADHQADRYLHALGRELELKLANPQSVETVFIGGGTPTQLDAVQLERLVTLTQNWLPVVSGGEWTVEANPNTLDLTKVELLAKSGVTRISLGAQSFQSRLLATLERDHDPDSVRRAAAMVAHRFESWSLDLIFGVPGSTLEDWKSDLEAALSLAPPHLSCYGLVYEKGTPLWSNRLSGRVQALDEDLEYEMYAWTIERLAAEGLLQYEISNFARPGHESRHNLVYWRNDAYIGVGLGAASYQNGIRTVNTRDLDAYLKRVEAGLPATGPTERLDAESRARETAVLMLRRVRTGLNRVDFAQRTGFEIDRIAGPAIARGISRGWLLDDQASLRLSPAGVFVADSVLSEFLP